MAKFNPKVPLWDPKHPGGQGRIDEDPELMDLLFDNIQDLKTSLDLTEEFWALLQQGRVVDERAITKIKALKPKQQIQKLVTRVSDGQVYQFHGFLWAMANTGQNRCMEVLGSKVEDYIDDRLLKSYLPFKCPSCAEFFSKAYILSGCGHYLCQTCIKATILKIQESDGKEGELACPLLPCGVTTLHEGMNEEGDVMGLIRDNTVEEICRVLVTNPNNNTNMKDDTRRREELISNLLNKMKEMGPTLETINNKMDMVNDADKKMANHIKAEKEQIVATLNQWEIEQQQAWSDVRNKVNIDHALAYRRQLVLKHLTLLLTRGTSISPALVKAISDIVGKAPPVLNHSGNIPSSLNAPFTGTIHPVELKERKEQTTTASQADGHLDIQPTMNSFAMEMKYSAQSVAWTCSGNLLLITEGGGELDEFEVMLQNKQVTKLRCHQGDSNYSIKMIHVNSEGTGGWASCGKSRMLFSKACNVGHLDQWKKGVGGWGILTSEGGRKWTTKLESSPTCIALTTEHICVASGGAVYIYDEYQQFLFQHPFTTTGDPITSMDAFDNLLTATSSSGLHILNLDTRFYRNIKGRGESHTLKDPCGICIHPNTKHIFLCDEGAIWMYTYQGEFVEKFFEDITRSAPRDIAILKRRGYTSVMAVAGEESVSLFHLHFTVL